MKIPNPENQVLRNFYVFIDKLDPKLKTIPAFQKDIAEILKKVGAGHQNDFQGNSEADGWAQVETKNVEGKSYVDTYDACFRIGDLIQKILSSGKDVSKELEDKCNKVLKLSGIVLDSSSIKNTSSARINDSSVILALSKSLRGLLEDQEFLNNFDSHSFNKTQTVYSPALENMPDIKTKEDFAKIIQQYVDLLNRFALESFPATRRTRQG